MKPYGELQAYARCVDVAVLPYRKKEPTYSGSSTRFYEHLAAGRPMVATRGFAELLEKEPLLTLVDTADEMAAALEHLRSLDFRDGHEAERWEASKQGTWEERARAMRATIQPRHEAEVKDASVAVGST
jgi:glycosyltransferase involved in cell wall biosynthesis